ncbi:hypothetical protein M1D55_17090 [Cupriavidus sp. JZ107]
MYTTSTGAAAPQQSISEPLPLQSDVDLAAAGELPVPPLLALGADDARVALESRDDSPVLSTVFEALEHSGQPHPGAHLRELLGALLQNRGARLSNCLVRDVEQFAGLANQGRGAAPWETPRAYLARLLADAGSPQAAAALTGTMAACSQLQEQAARLALRPGASPSSISAIESGLPAMPADLQAAWLAEWLAWPQPPAGVQDKAMALIHSGQLSDAARTNLLAKVTVRNLMSPPASSPAALHPL